MARRVALISSSYDPYPGGVEEHTRNVARELRDRGHAVEVWTVDRGEHLGTRLVDGITVHYLPTPLPSASPRGIIAFGLAAVPAWTAWRRVVRDFRPDVLHVQCFGPNGVYAWALHRVTRIPLVISSHGETFADENDVFAQSRLLAGGLVRALRDADAVTGCSRMVIEDLQDRFRLDTGSIVPNGVDLDEAARLGVAGTPHVASDPATVFAVGRLVRVKGFDLLIKAFAAASPPKARLVVGGDGPEIFALQAMARNLGVAECVVFPGRLDRPSVIEGMATADVIVVPSRAEAFGIVVLEAWRSGTPLICTNTGGPGELVDNGVNGLLVDPADTDKFAAALAGLLSDAEQRARLAREGRRSVKSYTWDRVADHYTKLYDGQAAGRPCPQPRGFGQIPSPSQRTRCGKPRW